MKREKFEMIVNWNLGGNVIKERVGGYKKVWIKLEKKINPVSHFSFLSLYFFNFILIKKI